MMHSPQSNGAKSPVAQCWFRQADEFDYGKVMITSELPVRSRTKLEITFHQPTFSISIPHVPNLDCFRIADIPGNCALLVRTEEASAGLRVPLSSVLSPRFSTLHISRKLGMSTRRAELRLWDPIRAEKMNESNEQ